MVKENLKALLQLEYDAKKLKFYVLDDSTEMKIRSQIKSICKKDGIQVI